jgi:hypothetical protein
MLRSPAPAYRGQQVAGARDAEGLQADDVEGKPETDEGGELDCPRQERRLCPQRREQKLACSIDEEAHQDRDQGDARQAR